MQTNTTSAIPGRVDPAELDRHIAEMYRDVANEARGDLHFPTGRSLAEALGYPADLLDRVPAQAVNSFAGVGYHLGLARLLPGERVLDLGSGSGMDEYMSFRRARNEELPFENGSFDAVISNGVINLSPDKPGVFAEAARGYRFASERARRTSEKYGAHSVSLLALKTSVPSTPPRPRSSQ
jgi:arsenite methyltransferase